MMFLAVPLSALEALEGGPLQLWISHVLERSEK